MRRRYSNLFRNHKVVLILAILALVSLFFLAISLESLEFESGEIFKTQGENVLASILKLLSLDRIFTIFVVVLLVLGVISVIYVLTKKELRKEFLKRFLQLALFMALFALMILFRSGGEEAQPTPTPTPIIAPTAISVPQFLDNDFEFSQELPPPVEPPSGITYLLSFIVVIAIGAIAWSLWVRGKKPDLRELADIAQAASDDIEAGFDIEDVIMRCYVQMMDVVKRRRGLNRKEAMTPAEFAFWLEGAGLPGEPLHRLTRLFERVRYGAYLSSKEEARQASDCLHDIAVFCGEGRG
jgi:hypothetical protein